MPCSFTTVKNYAFLRHITKFESDMGKLLGLDIGDAWVGIAITDREKIVARPYETIKATELFEYVSSLVHTEEIEQIIVGNPLTMKGIASDQTKKIKSIFEKLQTTVSIPCVLWDERLSSKRASGHLKSHAKSEKQREHAIAAAYILDSYLLYLSLHRSELP